MNSAQYEERSRLFVADSFDIALDAVESLPGQSCVTFHERQHVAREWPDAEIVQQAAAELPRFHPKT